MHYIALSLQTRSHDPRENARRARRKLCSTGLRHDTSKLCYDVACRYSRWASNVAAACSVGAQIFLSINVFIFVISCMRDYVVCVVTLIYTRVRACMHACATVRGIAHLKTCPQKVLQKLPPKLGQWFDGFRFGGYAKHGATRQLEILGHLLWKVSVNTDSSTCEQTVRYLSVQWWHVILSSEILGHLLRERGWRHVAIRAERSFANNLCIGRANLSSEILGHLLREKEWDIY